MKKAIVVMLLAFLVLNASAQNRKNPSVNEVFVGVRGGVNVASMRFTDKHQSSLDKTNAVKPLIGAFVEMPLNDRFVVAPGISYIERGVKINYTHYSGNEMHYEINSKYLDFRLPVLYKMNVKSLVRPYLVAGAEIDCLLGGDISLNDDVVDIGAANMNAVDLGVFAGVGCGFYLSVNGRKIQFKIEAIYNVGLIDSYSAKEKKENSQAVNVNAYNFYGKRFNNGLEISLNIALSLKKEPKGACMGFK